MDPATPGPPPGAETSPAPARPPFRAGRSIVLVAFVAAVAVGYLLYRRIEESAPPPAAGPPPGTLVKTVPVSLSPKAAIIADRFNCLCGQCSDTLGACTCTRDEGSNEMKATLDKLVQENKTLQQIEAAMVAKYGSHVLASGAPKPAGK